MKILTKTEDGYFYITVLLNERESFDDKLFLQLKKELGKIGFECDIPYYKCVEFYDSLSWTNHPDSYLDVSYYLETIRDYKINFSLSCYNSRWTASYDGLYYGSHVNFGEAMRIAYKKWLKSGRIIREKSLYDILRKFGYNRNR